MGDEQDRQPERRAKRSVLGAAMLGTGAIFQTKVDPEEHWSSTPKVVLVVDEAVAGDDQPVSISFDAVPESPPRPRPARRRRRWLRRPSRI